jgi:dynein heavy chain
LSLEKELNIDFKRTMNKITFDHIIAGNQQTFSFVSVPPKEPEAWRERGCVTDLPDYDFDGQFYNFSFVSLLTKEEAIEALTKVRVECNKVAAMSLFQMPNKHMKLEEFEQAQTQQTYQV